MRRAANLSRAGSCHATPICKALMFTFDSLPDALLAMGFIANGKRCL
jgi:hypothetical protein